MSLSGPLRHVLDRKWRLLLYPFLATSSVVFINDNVAEINWIDRNSMSPTLSPAYHETGRSDYVLFNKVDPLRRRLQRGDVVSFWSPLKPECFVVKRVVALEGDTVLLDPKRRPGVEGTPSGDAERRHWALMGRWDWGGGATSSAGGGAAHDERGEHEHGHGGLAPRRARRPAVTVPFGHVWVEGDNWRDTEDSNTYGPISQSLIQGRAVRLLWPPSRFWSQPWLEPIKTTAVIPGQKTVPEEWQDL